MSHVASNFVKHLTISRTGEKITPAEKCVLGLLADDHNQDQCRAWPSVTYLAERACMSLRHCQRLLRSLEKKKVIESSARLRDHDSQTSNWYRFCELDPPFDKKESELTQKRMEVRISANRNKRTFQMRLPSVAPHDIGVIPPMTSVSPSPRHRSRGAHDTVVAPGATPTSPLEPLLEPPLEPSVEQSSEPTIPTLSQSERKSGPSKGDLDRWDRFIVRLKSDLHSIPASLAELKEFRVIEPSQGAMPHSRSSDFDVCFRGWWLEEVRRMPNGIMLVTTAEDDEATAKGLEKYKARLQATARKYFGAHGQKTAITFKLLRNAEPMVSAEPPVLVLTGAAASEAEASAAMALYHQQRTGDVWTLSKARLQELLLKRKDAKDAMRNFRDAIEPVTLRDVVTTNGAVQWQLQSPAPKKSTAVMALYRREVNEAIRLVAGRVVTVTIT